MHDAEHRLEAVEADLSVLGTVVRQIAEAVADLEEARRRQQRKDQAAPLKMVPPAAPAERPRPQPQREEPPPFPEEPEPVAVADQPQPVIPVEMLKQAIEDGRLVFHLLPIVTLPQRKAAGYDLVPRLALDDDEFADPADFMPAHGGEAVIRRIERLALEEAVTIARRARTSGRPVTLYIPVSAPTLIDAAAIERAGILLEANRAVAPSIVFLVAETEWAKMPTSQRAALAAFVGKGTSLSLGAARSLRLDFATLAAEGIKSVRFNAGRFIEEPETLTDFHTSDVAAYLNRYGVDAVATGVHTEDQALTLLEDGIGFAQGPHLGESGPARADLVLERFPVASRAKA